MNVRELIEVLQKYDDKETELDFIIPDYVKKHVDKYEELQSEYVKLNKEYFNKIISAHDIQVVLHMAIIHAIEDTEESIARIKRIHEYDLILKSKQA